MNTKQITFPHRMSATHVYPDGSIECVRYGQYEAIVIVKENGWPVNRTVKLGMPNRYKITEMEKVDGTKVIFDEPYWLISEYNYGDDSSRLAPRL